MCNCIAQSRGASQHFVFIIAWSKGPFFHGSTQVSVHLITVNNDDCDTMTVILRVFEGKVLRRIFAYTKLKITRWMT